MKINLEIEFEIGNRAKITKKHILLLKQIQQGNSISKAAENLNISYKNAWDSLDEINKACDNKIFLLSSKKSGKKLSNFALEIIKKYDEFCDFKNKINNDFRYKISAQNTLKVQIKEIKNNISNISVKTLINNDLIESTISQNALKELDLKIGDFVYLIFKINFIELEKSGANSFSAKIINIKEDNNMIYFILDFHSQTLHAYKEKSQMKKIYKINDEIDFVIPKDKIIISL